MSSTDFTDGVTLTDDAWFDDVNTHVYGYLTSISGADTITAAGPVSMVAYAAGQRFRFIAAGTNTGAVTLNITPSGASALGAKAVTRDVSTALVAGDISSGMIVEVIYDGTRFQITHIAGDARPALKVNGTANALQTILDLLNGSNIAITDNGNGTVTIAVTGIGTTIEGYDATIAKTGAVNSWTKGQRGTPVALTSAAASIAIDLDLANNFTHTLTENTTLVAPTNAVAGQSGVIVFTQHASAPKTLAYNAFWNYTTAAAPTLTATNSAVDLLSYYIESATRGTIVMMNNSKVV